MDNFEVLGDDWNGVPNTIGTLSYPAISVASGGNTSYQLPPHTNKTQQHIMLNPETIDTIANKVIEKLKKEATYGRQTK